jgi:mobilome CxxCx(11)CxxC protein
MPRTPETDRTCVECWNRALHAYGTAQIFLKRSRNYTWKLRTLAFVGIAGPVVIGGMVIHGIGPSYLPKFLFVVGVVSIIEGLVSVWSLAFTWADDLSYSQRSAAENLSLSSAFRELAQQCENPLSDFDSRFASLRSTDEARRVQDTEKRVTEKQLRYAHRAGLRQFRRDCEGCKKVPTSMESTDCNICGKFGLFD